MSANVPVSSNANEDINFFFYNCSIDAMRLSLGGNPQTIGSAFAWGASPQGYDFWQNEYHNVHNGKPLSAEAIKAIEEFIVICELLR